jgi:hypothetical protein
VFQAWRWPQPGQRPASPLTIAQVLRRWAAEVPEDAETVQRLAVGAAETLFLAGEFEAAHRIAQAGLDASLLGALANGERRAAATWLALLGARAAFEMDDPAGARVLVDRVGDTADSSHPLAHYLRMHRNLVEARLAEASLEIDEARQSYTVAAELAAALTTGRRARALLGPWTDLVFGSNVPPDQGSTLLGPEMRQARQLAVLGLARTSHAAEPAREAVDLVVEEGLTEEAVLGLTGVLAALPPEELDEAAARLVADEEDPNRVVGVRALQADAWLAHGEIERARLVIEEVFRATRPPSDAITYLMVFAVLARQRHLAGDHTGVRDAIDMLLDLLAEVAPQLVGSTINLRVRAACEPALVAAVGEPGGRERTTKLIEALRTPEDAEVSSDRIGRLAFAVRNRPGVLVLVIQSVGEEAAFLCIGPDGETTTRSAVAQRALDALTDGVDAALRQPIALDTLGLHAFDALPEEVRAGLRGASTVVVVPDFTNGRDRVPVELLHDGQSFLGVSKVISRCLSLAHALRVLEPPLVPRSSARRALCVAVSSAPGLPDLAFADTEIGSVRDALAGWDVQAWTGVQAEPRALLEIAPLAGVLHLACHGDSAAGAEALVLGEGARLKALDIATRHRLSCVTYLNACSLGRGRYVGGGLSRGVAYAFVRAGSPAVIANLSPVEDRGAAELATTFYAEARDHPVGEALRRARARLAELVNPVLWGTTVLIGTPFQHLDGTAAEQEDATAVLFDGEPLPTRERLDHARATADPDDLRLATALAFADTREAGLAREIGHDIGAADCLLELADVARQEGDPDQLETVLRHLVRTLEPLRGKWEPAYEAHRDAVAELRSLDPTYEPREVETFRLSSGLTINDRSDPAVDAVMSLQEALFEHERHWRGDPTLIVPDLTVNAVAHNAVVWGFRHRLHHTGVEAPYARSCAERLAWRGLIDEDAVPVLHRVLAGLLHFLWGRHKITHLENWMLRGHTRVVEIAVERARRVPPFAEETSRFFDQLVPSAASGSKYARARAALSSGPSTSRVDEAITFVRQAFRQTAALDRFAAADYGAWVLGDLIERSGQPRQDAVLVFRSVFDGLDDREESWIEPYLTDGFAEIRDIGGADLFARWSRENI